MKSLQESILDVADKNYKGTYPFFVPLEGNYEGKCFIIWAKDKKEAIKLASKEYSGDVLFEDKVINIFDIRDKVKEVYYWSE